MKSTFFIYLLNSCFCQILSLTQKIYELKGKMKRPNLKRVKKSADAVLGALTDNRVTKADFKANLKTVKKEEEKVKLCFLTSALVLRESPVCLSPQYE